MAHAGALWIAVAKKNIRLTDREPASMPKDRGVCLWVLSNWGGGLIGLKLVFLMIPELLSY